MTGSAPTFPGHPYFTVIVLLPVTTYDYQFILTTMMARWTVVFLVYAALVLDNILLTVVGGTAHKKFIE